MLDLGLDVLFKGKNMARLMGGLGVALKISAASVLISLPLGILLGVLMTFRNPSSTLAQPARSGGTFPARRHRSSCSCCGALPK